MKKKIALILILCAMTSMLCSCSTVSYDKAIEDSGKTRLGGYFTVLKEWDDSYMGKCKILYADDSHVMYLFIDGYRSYALTPLYNADGTLQIYKGE